MLSIRKLIPALLLFNVFIASKASTEQPFSQLNTLLGDDEAVIIWNELNDDGNLALVHQIVNPDSIDALDNIGDSIIVGTGSNNENYGHRHVATQTGNLNNDRFDDVVVAYTDNQGNIYIGIPEINRNALSSNFQSFTKHKTKQVLLPLVVLKALEK